MVKPREKEDRDAGQQKRAVVSLGAISRDDVELRPAQPPPGLRQGTVGHPAVVQNVLGFVALGPFPFKMKRRFGSEKTGFSGDSRLRLPNHLVEFAVLVALLG